MNKNDNDKSHLSDSYNNFYDEFLNNSNNSQDNTLPRDIEFDADFYNTDNDDNKIENEIGQSKEEKGLFYLIEKFHQKKVYRYSILSLFALVISFIIFLVLGSLNIIKLPWKKYPLVLQLSQNEIMLKYESDFQLAAEVYPNDKDFGKIIYTSSDPSIVAVNSDTGSIVAKANGIATVTAYLEDYKKIYDECRIVVSDNNVMVNKISVENENIDILKGNKYLLRYTYLPKNAGIYNFTYISSDQSIVKVNEKGEVFAVGEGQAIVTIQETSNKASVTQKFTVHSNNDNKKIVSSIVSSTDKINLVIGGEAQIGMQMYPLYVPQFIIWTSLDRNIATISNNGVVTGINHGKTKVIATAVDGTYKIIDVNVSEESIAIEKISINEKSLSLNIGESKIITTKIKPSNATNKKISWTSSDSNIVKVNDSGIAMGVSSGQAVITASINEGDSLAKIPVTVTEKVISVNVNDVSISSARVAIDVGSSSSIKANINPRNATNQKLIWKSGNDKIATVSDGMIYGKSEGTTMVSVTTEDANITKSILVMVNAVPLKAIALNKEKIEIGAESQVQLIVSYTPSNATYKNITWTSSDSNIAIVDENGLVTTKHKGSAIITAKSSNGLTKDCMVVVTNEFIHVTSITLSNNQYTVKVGEKIGITPVITPSNATNPKVTITSSNPNLVKVLEDGNIEGVREGVTTITVTTVDGNKKATAYVVVKNRNTSIQYTDGTTIKYWYDDSYKTYAITHIWVKNAYEQFKGEMSDKFGTLSSPSYMTTKAAKKNPGKTLISINASSHVSTAFNRPLYEVDRAYNNTIPSPIVIFDGKVLRDYSTKHNQPLNNMRIYGMDKDGNLKYYPIAANKDQNVGLAKRILDDGVKYTFSFQPALVSNGKEETYRITKDNNIRQSICQIDANNFIYITNISSNRSIGFSTYSLAKKMVELGCQTGFNLDGGGSTSIYYVKKGATKSTKIRVLEGTYGRSIPDIMYFVGE